MAIAGCYRKDFPQNVLRAFDPNFATIICIDPPGYGQSRPPDRKQELQLNKKDGKFGIALMKVSQSLMLIPSLVNNSYSTAEEAKRTKVEFTDANIKL